MLYIVKPLLMKLFSAFQKIVLTLFDRIKAYFRRLYLFNRKHESFKAIFQFGAISILLPKHLLSGFNCGVAFHVLTSQVTLLRYNIYIYINCYFFHIQARTKISTSCLRGLE